MKRKIVKTKQSSLRSIAAEEKLALWQLDDADIKKRIKRINLDFANAFKLLRQNTDTVTFFGSARFDENNQYYIQARNLARKISQELKLTIVSGGGPGIMEAANRGASEACSDPGHDHYDDKAPLICGNSLAMTIQLPKEQATNPYVKHSAGFYYFFSRKVALVYSARAYVYFPGGFGTLDEFFEVLTLKQTGKIANIPIILCGKDYWQPLLSYLDETLYKKTAAISNDDLNLFTLTDDDDEIVEIIKQSKIKPL